MGTISRIEKQELLAKSHSLKIKSDFQSLMKNRDRFKINFDEYIKFLNFANFFVNHRQKPFKKIKGNIFKI
jgi:hypothetical protein